MRTWDYKIEMAPRVEAAQFKRCEEKGGSDNFLYSVHKLSLFQYALLLHRHNERTRLLVQNFIGSRVFWCYGNTARDFSIDFGIFVTITRLFDALCHKHSIAYAKTALGWV